MRRLWTLPATVLLGLGTVLVSHRALAASPQEIISQLDTASSEHDVQGVMRFYSSNFSNSDGLNTKSLEQALTQQWQQYPNLTYQTQIQSVTPTSTGAQVETLTTIQGKQERSNGEIWTIESQLRARQTIQNDQILRQEILSEKTTLSLGENPPTVKFNLPETVKVGQQYDLDAIVQEPIGEDLLMGSLLDQKVTLAMMTRPDRLAIDFPSIAELLSDRNIGQAAKTDPNVQYVKLERLKSGGFFKIGQETTPGTHWISAILARHDAGMTIVTQRLRVVSGS